MISASVLKAVFGSRVKNIVGGEYLSAKSLLDHEPVIRDVCEKCNNEYLSPYDTAGISFINQLIPSNDPTGLRLFLTRESLGWLIKTHLNCIRVIKDRETNEIYQISNQLKAALVQRAEMPEDLFRLMIEGWVGEPYFWDADDSRRIPWFSYRSVRFPRQRLVISDFRIKTLTTWLVIPSDAHYDCFDQRVNSVLKQVSQQFGFQLQLVDPKQTIEDGYVDLTCVLPVETVKRFIVQRQQLN